MSAKEEIIEKVSSVGSVAASLLWPYDFECYMVAFELCDGVGKTIDYLSFPITPENLQIEETPAVNIKNTFGGVSVVSSELYTPKTISLRGNFGRAIKVLSRGDITASFTSLGGFEFERSYSKDLQAKKTSELSHNIKTGYGTSKVLQSILNKSYGVHKTLGVVNKLYFYNLAFGESYVVKVTYFKISQSLENNMLWNYDITLKTISPLDLDKQKTNSSLIKSFGVNVVQNGINSLLKSLL